MEQYRDERSRLGIPTRVHSNFPFKTPNVAKVTSNLKQNRGDAPLPVRFVFIIPSSGSSTSKLRTSGWAKRHLY
eukprot:2290871-Rhodomonas_salina.1